MRVRGFAVTGSAFPSSMKSLSWYEPATLAKHEMLTVPGVSSLTVQSMGPGPCAAARTTASPAPKPLCTRFPYASWRRTVMTVLCPADMATGLEGFRPSRRHSDALVTEGTTVARNFSPSLPSAEPMDAGVMCRSRSPQEPGDTASEKRPWPRLVTLQGTQDPCISSPPEGLRIALASRLSSESANSASLPDAA